MVFKKGDRVKGINPKYPSYTGRVDEVFYGFVKIVIDQPHSMGPTTLTSVENIELLGPPIEELPLIFPPGVQVSTGSPPPLTNHPITNVEAPPVVEPTEPLPTESLLIEPSIQSFPVQLPTQSTEGEGK